MIEIDTDALKEYGRDLESLTYDYFSVINKVFTRISDMPTTTGEWVGASANRFARVANVDKKQYIEMYRISRLYSTYLINSANKVDYLCKRIKKQ